MKQALVILVIFGLIHIMLTASVPSPSTTTAATISNEESDMTSSEEESVISVRTKRGNCNKGAEKLTIGSQNGTVLIPATPPAIDIRGSPQPIG
ncbi:unnamed protein product [Diamesa hyperborea]